MKRDIKQASAMLLATMLATHSFVAEAGRTPFDVTGSVLLVNSGDIPQVYLLAEQGVFQCWDVADKDKNNCRNAGDVVRLLGYNDDGSTALPSHFATNATLVSKSTAQFNPPLVEAQRLLAGHFRGKPVAVSGVVMSVLRDDIDSQWNWIVLNTDAGRVHVAVTENTVPLESMRSLSDAEVVVRGIDSKPSNCRAFLPQAMLMSGVNGLSVVKPAPADPFTAAPVGAGPSLHRQTCKGIVVGHGHGVVFITAEGGKFMPVFLAAGEEPPTIGSTATVSGFASDGQTGPQLTEAVVLVRATAEHVMSASTRLSAKELFTDDSGHDIASFNYANKVISICGTVESSPESHHLAGAAIINVAGHRVTVDLSNVAASLPPGFGHGYEIDVSGICYAEFDNSPHLSFPTFKGFTIYPRCADDVKIVRRPPWWTLPRMIVVVAALAAILVAFVIWNRALQMLSVRRGRELAREQLRHAKSSLKVEERTNLAVELHDSISQTLVGVAMQIETALGIAGDSLGPARRFLDVARQMLESCRQELKGCLWDLRSRTFEERDIAEMLRKTVSAHSGDASVTIQFNIPREALSESSIHTILRIVRELVANAVRHGKARHISISGDFCRRQVCFSVEDDGYGFDPSTAGGPSHGHFGLQGVRERAKKMGGTVEITSSPGKGSKITVILKEPGA